MNSKYEEIINLIDKIREQNGFAHSDVDVVKLATRNGFLVCKLKEDAKLKGFIFGDPNNMKAGLIAFKKDLTEKENRFIIAHELGHYFLHNKDKEFLSNGYFYYAYHENGSAESEKEQEADFFAANLLVPKKIFLEKVNEIGDLRTTRIGKEILSDYFNVTVPCIERRMVETNALSEK